MSQPIYLDNGRITRPSDHCIAQMQPFFKRHWLALEAPYLMGKEPESTIKRVRSDLYAFVGAHEKDRFQFCSSGKEGQFNVFHAFYVDHVMEQGKNHLIVEKESDLSHRFDGMGLCTHVLPKNEKGQITREILEAMITPKTGLVSLSWADGETGVIHPIWELGELCREKGILFHVDASHILGKLYFKFSEMPIDFLSFEGTLIHGPRGSGGVFIRRGIEYGAIDGELNLPAFVGLGIAIEELSESFDHLCMETVRLRDKFEEGIHLALPEAKIFYQDVERLPHTSVIEFPGVKNELLSFHLEERGVYVSFDRLKECTLTFSLSRNTTEEEIDRAIGMVVDAAQKCRTFSRELVVSAKRWGNNEEGFLGLDTSLMWKGYSNLLKERILNPRNLGVFKENAGAMQEMRVVIGEGTRQGNRVKFSLVVDETDGVIADAKFLCFGESLLVGAADTACEVLLRKTYDQARRLKADLIDRKVRDFTNIPAFPKEGDPFLNLVLSAIEEAAEKCQDIPLQDPSVAPPVPGENGTEGGDPNWHLFSPEEKLDHIKEVIRDEIQPYIELDAGGIEVSAFKDEKEIIIAYQGACTTCPSSTGATLDAIQQILRSRLSPTLTVKPDLSLLSF